MIMSFAWTTPALLLGEKTETRRDWGQRTVTMVQNVIFGRNGGIIEAWDKSPRFGGKPVAIIRPKNLTVGENPATEMPDEAWMKEGFGRLFLMGTKPVGGRPSDSRFYHEYGRHAKPDCLDVWEFWRGGDNIDQCVLAFEIQELLPHGKYLLPGLQRLDAAKVPMIPLHTALKERSNILSAHEWIEYYRERSPEEQRADEELYFGPAANAAYERSKR